MSRVQCGRKLFEMLSHRWAGHHHLCLEGRAGTVEKEAAQALDFDTGELLYGVGLRFCLECSPEYGRGGEGEVGGSRDISKTSRVKGLPVYLGTL